MRRYKDILVSRKSDLSDALSENKPKLAETIYKATTERYKAAYPPEDRAWFDQMSKREVPYENVE